MKTAKKIFADFSCGLIDYVEFKDVFYSGTLPQELLNDIPLCVVEFVMSDSVSNVIGQLEARDNLRNWGSENQSTAKQLSNAKLKAFNCVKLKILSAFNYASLGNGMTLAQANAVDSYLSLEEQMFARERDMSIAWQDYPVHDLEGYTALLYLDAEGFSFYIPAYLCWCINDRLTNPFSNIASETFSAFNPFLTGFGRRIGSLNAMQKNAIREFLWLFAIFSEIYRETCIAGMEALGCIGFEAEKLCNEMNETGSE
jgi:hypothetical protein